MKNNPEKHPEIDTEHLFILDEKPRTRESKNPYEQEMKKIEKNQLENKIMQEENNNIDEERGKYSQFVQFYNSRMQTERNDRNNFIKKIYFLLSIQLTYTTIFVGLINGISRLKSGIKETTPVAITCGCCSVFLCCVAFCCVKLVRKYPANYIILLLFTLVESYLVAFLCSYYSSISVLAAAFIAVGITFTLGVYVHISKKTFTI